ncbi:glutathione transferase GstA [Legionella lytica]|uniref:Glutathione transferase GstA n=1 Tax=Legionella lytica TaxID=96232 RepID=A0ABW8D790_9GAMM
MKFYYCKSACSLAVRIILNELDFSYQDVEVDLKAKKTKNDEDFWAINPKGAVPAIMLDNGQVLTENQVILQYLADTAKEQKVLAPIGDLKRYHTLEWLNYVATELHKSIGMFFNPALTEEMKKDIYMPMIQAKLKFVNEHLGKSTYLMGEQFTLPDAYLFVILRWAYYFKMDLSAVPHIEKFMQHLKTRPSVAKALQQEQV